MNPDDKQSGFSCDWSAPSTCALAGDQPPATEALQSALYPFDSATHSWGDITPEAYKSESGGWSGIVRHVLLGNRGEPAAFDLRYFEIAPGGHSSLEKHHHVHVVIVVRGRGQVLAGGEVRALHYLDTVYIAPNDPHQLFNPADEPFGFFCLVDHHRDRPRLLETEELAVLLHSPVREAIRP